jgi:hypothetical protein
MQKIMNMIALSEASAFLLERKYKNVSPLVLAHPKDYKRFNRTIKFHTFEKVSNEIKIFPT